MGLGFWVSDSWFWASGCGVQVSGIWGVGGGARFKVEGLFVEPHLSEVARPVFEALVSGLRV